MNILLLAIAIAESLRTSNLSGLHESTDFLIHVIRSLHHLRLALSCDTCNHKENQLFKHSSTRQDGAGIKIEHLPGPSPITWHMTLDTVWHSLPFPPLGVDYPPSLSCGRLPPKPWKATSAGKLRMERSWCNGSAVTSESFVLTFANCVTWPRLMYSITKLHCERHTLNYAQRWHKKKGRNKSYQKVGENIPNSNPRAETSRKPLYGKSGRLVISTGFPDFSKLCSKIFWLKASDMWKWRRSAGCCNPNFRSRTNQCSEARSFGGKHHFGDPNKYVIVVMLEWALQITFQKQLYILQTK